MTLPSVSSNVESSIPFSFRHALLIILAFVLTAASAACTRDFLKAATDDCIVAQAAGKPEGVVAFASANLNYSV